MTSWLLRIESFLRKCDVKHIIRWCLMLNPIEKNPNFTCIVWQPHKDAGRVIVPFHVSPSTKKPCLLLKWANMLRIADSGSQMLSVQSRCSAKSFVSFSWQSSMFPLHIISTAMLHFKKTPCSSTKISHYFNSTFKPFNPFVFVEKSQPPSHLQFPAVACGDSLLICPQKGG